MFSLFQSSRSQNQAMSCKVWQLSWRCQYCFAQSRQVLAQTSRCSPFRSYIRSISERRHLATSCREPPSLNGPTAYLATQYFLSLGGSYADRARTQTCLALTAWGPWTKQQIVRYDFWGLWCSWLRFYRGFLPQSVGWPVRLRAADLLPSGSRSCALLFHLWEGRELFPFSRSLGRGPCCTRPSASGTPQQKFLCIAAQCAFHRGLD